MKLERIEMKKKKDREKRIRKNGPSTEADSGPTV